MMLSNNNKNILTMLLGTGSAQAIPIVASIILTRLYSPEDYGILAIFLAITVILSSIITSKYELAILVPKNDEDAINITVIAIISSIVFSFIIFLIILFFGKDILMKLGAEDIGYWMYLIPLTTLFSGLYTSLNYMAIRIGIFRIISRTKVYQSLSAVIFQITFGLMKSGHGGLIIGSVISQMVGNINLFKSIYQKCKDEHIEIKKENLINLMKKYSDYPKYSIFATLLNNLSLQSLNFVIPIFYSPALLGFYSLSQRIIMTPMNVISSSVSQVFLSSASLELQESKKARKTFISFTFKLLIISLPIYITLYFIVKPLIVFVYGVKWIESGEIAQIVMILLFFRFIMSPLSGVINLYEKQLVALFWQFSLLALTVISILYSSINDLRFYDFLYVYVFALTLNYIAMYIYCLILSHIEKIEKN